MAWNQVTVMEQKLQFVSLAATGRFTFTQLCADFHINAANNVKRSEQRQTQRTTSGLDS